MSEQVEPVVCIAHGAFIPCRHSGGHRLTGSPYWVKVVADYQGSSVEGLTWEPAWENDTPAPTVREQCGQCGPGYRIGDEGCRHTPTVREGGDVAEVLRDHWPDPVFGCECTPTDDESGQTETLPNSWENHVADLLEPLIAEREANAWDECFARYFGGADDANPYRAALTPETREDT